MGDVRMAIDPTQFHPINVADTCTVWNLLSSKLLFAAALSAKCDFCITGFVSYECLRKPRKTTLAQEAVLVTALHDALARRTIQEQSCTISDLQDIEVLEARRKLGKGELSSLAYARKISQAFMTDDQKARKLAAEVRHAPTQTTPHLFGWLIFKRVLTDADRGTVVSQHVASGRPLQKYLDEAYDTALKCLLNVPR